MPAPRFFIRAPRAAIEPSIAAMARFDFDAAMRARTWREWRRHSSRYRRFAPWLACMLVALGAVASAVFATTSMEQIGAVGAIVLGIAVAWQDARARASWFAELDVYWPVGTVIEAKLDEDGMRVVVDGGVDEEFGWEDFDGVVETPRGMFLRFADGSVPIYIPDEALQPPRQKAAVLARMVLTGLVWPPDHRF